MSHDVLISVDIETSGLSPAIHSILTIGACVIESPVERFDAMLRPLTAAYERKALKINGLTLQECTEEGLDPAVAMQQFAGWVGRVSRRGRPVMVGWNAQFDFAFLDLYFQTYLRDNPFGHAPLDAKTYYWALTGCDWKDTAFGRIDERYRPRKDVAHIAMQDALDQASAFSKMREDFHDQRRCDGQCCQHPNAGIERRTAAEHGVACPLAGCAQ